MALSVSLPIIVSLNQTSVLDIASGSAPLAISFQYVFSSGTSAYQGITFTSDQRTLGTGAVDAFDLAGGLVDIFGNVVTFARIRAILVQTSVGSAGILSLFSTTGGNSFVGPMVGGTDVSVRPGCTFVCVAPDADGWVVAAGTGDLFRVENASPGNIDYNIVIIGTT